MPSRKPSDHEKAWAYIENRVQEHPQLKHDLVTLVKYIQQLKGLSMDGKPGDITQCTIDDMFSPASWIHPLPADIGVLPQVSSAHANSNPSRPTHRGADIMYKVGGKWVIPHKTAVLASADGVVIRRSEHDNGWCLAVETAAGFIYQHRHLAEPYVALGKHVHAGEKLGLFDQTQSPPHCHFEIYAPGLYDYWESLDPGPFLRHMRIIQG